MKLRQLNFEAIGTKWSIDIASEVSDATWESLQNQISNRIEQFDKTYSRFREDSWITKLSKKAGTYELPDDAMPLIAFYKELYDMTDGLVTPLIGQTVSDAGYDADYSMQSKRLSSPPAWEEVINCSGSKLTTKQPALLDFGAAGKGYLADVVGDIIEYAGISEFIINAGGDMLQRSAKNESIEVGLENPHDTSEVVATVRIMNKSLCASAGSRRTWGKYHHIINPDTLESPRDVAASWVVADTAMHADGLATALFFVQPDSLRNFNFEYAILDKDMGLHYSKNLAIKLFEAHA